MPRVRLSNLRKHGNIIFPLLLCSSFHYRSRKPVEIGVEGVVTNPTTAKGV